MWKSDSGTGACRLHPEWRPDALVGRLFLSPVLLKERIPMTPLLQSILGAVAGAAVGFLVYRFVGCKTGTCPITASPWTSMLVWGIVGAIAASGR